MLFPSSLRHRKAFDLGFSFFSYQAKNLPKRKYGCLMVLIPSSVASLIQAWSKKTIPEEHLAEEGREDFSHVTVKYGFEDDSQESIQRLTALVKKYGKFSLKIGKLSFFKGNEDGDVLKAEIESDQLRKLNAEISKLFACHDTHPTYIPHLTIAYLKPIHSAKYANISTPFLNRDVEIVELEYSSASKEKTRISLLQDEKALSYLSGTSGGSLVAPPAQGIRPSPFHKRSLFELLGEKQEKSLDYEVKGRKPSGRQEGVVWEGARGRCYTMKKRKDGKPGLRVAPAKCKKGEEGEKKDSSSSSEGQQQEQKQPVPKPKPKPKLGEVKQKPSVDSVQAGVEAFRTKENPTEDEKIIMINAISSLTVKEIKELQYRFLEKKEARGTRTGKRNVIVPKIVESILNKVRGTSIPPKQETPQETTYSDPVPPPEKVEAVLPERTRKEEEPPPEEAPEEVPSPTEEIPLEDPKTPQEEAIRQTLPQGVEAATEKAEAIQSVQENAQALLEQTQDPELQQEIIQQAEQETNDALKSINEIKNGDEWQPSAGQKVVQFRGMGGVTEQEAMDLLGNPDEKALYEISTTAPGGFIFVTAEKTTDGRLYIDIESHKDSPILVQRILYRDRNGILRAQNDYFEIPPVLANGEANPYKGRGAETFAKQVEQLQKLGAESIDTYAAGKPGEGKMNGYYTWPRVGYNAALPYFNADSFPPAVLNQLRSIPEPTVLDLFDIPGGKEWWKENGTSLDMVFDLKPGSRSLQVLNSYLQEKQNRKQEQSTLSSPNTTPEDSNKLNPGNSSTNSTQGTTSPEQSPSGFEEVFKNPGVPQIMSEVRQASGLSKEAFDKEVYRMLDEGKIYAIAYDYPAALSPEQLAQLVPAGDGSYFGFLAAHPDTGDWTPPDAGIQQEEPDPVESSATPSQENVTSQEVLAAAIDNIGVDPQEALQNPEQVQAIASSTGTSPEEVSAYLRSKMEGTALQGKVEITSPASPAASVKTPSSKDDLDEGSIDFSSDVEGIEVITSPQKAKHTSQQLTPTPLKRARKTPAPKVSLPRKKPTKKAFNSVEGIIKDHPEMTLAELRQALPELKGQSFDQVMLALHDSGKILLSQDVNPEAVGSQEVVTDEQGNIYGGLTVVSPKDAQRVNKGKTPSKGSFDQQEYERIRANKTPATGPAADLTPELQAILGGEPKQSAQPTEPSPLQETEQKFQELRGNKVPDYKKREFLGSLSALSDAELQEFGTNIGIAPERLTDKRAAINAITAKLNDKTPLPLAATKRPMIRLGDAPDIKDWSASPFRNRNRGF